MQKPHSNTITLHDGRTLGWSEFGAPDGVPVLYFHGFPGCRMEAGLADAAARKLGLRIVAVDRPGFGLSGFQPGRTLADWSADVSALADALGLARFRALGLSGGAPYLLACAAALPDRLINATIVAGLGPTDAPDSLAAMRWGQRHGLRAGRRFPRGLRALFRTLCVPVQLRPRLLVSHLRRICKPPDQEVLLDEDVARTLEASFAGALRGSSRGPAWELGLIAGAWNIRHEDVRIPVRLWHGEQDIIVPPAMGRHAERALPDCRATYLPGDGHFSITVRHMDAILGELLVEPEAP
jgi:pimeloyl-ACP methyl ester carboxylesterase